MTPSIEPGRSVGPVRLGMTRLEVLEVCGSPIRERGPNPDVLVILDFGPLSVGLVSGVANMLIVQEGQAGQTSDGIHVGTTWLDLVRSRGEPTYDADEMGSWVDAAEPGIWYDIVGPLWEGEETLDPPYHQEHLFVREPDRAFVRRMYVMSPGSQ